MSRNKNPPKWVSRLTGFLLLMLELIIIIFFIVMAAFGFLMLFVQPIM